MSEVLGSLLPAEDLLPKIVPTAVEIRKFLSNLELDLKDLPQVDIPIINHFSKSVYAREMRMPKGTLVIGKIHKHQNLNILSAGEVSVLSIDGVMRVKAPYTFVASPGTKRLIYAHEDVVWTTIHGTDETDVGKIEDEFIAKSYDDVLNEQIISNNEETLCLG